MSVYIKVVWSEGLFLRPPHFHAAPRLTTFIAELVGLLHHRGEALGARVTSTGRSSSAEIADYLLLQAINRVGFHVAGNVPGLALEFWAIRA